MALEFRDGIQRDTSVPRHDPASRAPGDVHCLAGPLPPPSVRHVRPLRHPAPQTHGWRKWAGLPSVSVPVLSKMIAFRRCARSRDSTSLIRMPERAAAPVPVMIAVGVARPSAHGQAITKYRDSGNERRFENAANEVPGSERDGRDGDDDRDENRTDQVHEPLHRRFAGLGVFDELE